jgi:poly(3-hydroxybutyrate) depolymerase
VHAELFEANGKLEMSLVFCIMIARNTIVAASALLLYSAGAAQSDCDGTRYRYTSTYENTSVSYDHLYGMNINAFGVDEELVFDFYEATGSVDSNRPLIIIAHGGFFLAGSNDGADVVPLCEDLARMGYAVASISYRLGIANLLDLENELVRAVWRGVHDGRAAIRYFRQSALDEGNPWGIDPDRIFLGGVSAGGFIALHHAYVDQESEIPANIDQSLPGLGGGLEGLSGSPDVSSEVAGIFNICGALKDADWIAAGDEPVVSVHGTADATVPFGSDMVSLMGFPVTQVDGSSVVHQQAEAVGLPHCFVPIEGADHVPHVTDATAYDLTLSVVAGALSTWLCGNYPAQCGEYDYTTNVATIETADVRLYPNPAPDGVAHLVNRQAEGTTWTARVLDAQGRIVLEQIGTGSAEVINLESLRSGWYVVEVGAWGWRSRLLVP